MWWGKSKFSTEGVCRFPPLRTEKSFRNLVNANRNQIVITIFHLIKNQTEFRLVPNESENGKYNLISDNLNRICGQFLCVYVPVLNFCLWGAIPPKGWVPMPNILTLYSLHFNYLSVTITEWPTLRKKKWSWWLVYQSDQFANILTLR